MGGSRLALLLFLYLAADFTNPLMPGAVSLDHGSVEAVHSERARTADVVPAAPAVAPSEWIDRSPVAWRGPRPTPVRPVTRFRVTLARRPSVAPPDAAPPEDH